MKYDDAIGSYALLCRFGRGRGAILTRFQRESATLGVYLKKEPVLILAIVALMLDGALLQSQQLTIQTETGKQTALTRTDIEAMPHIKVITQPPDNSSYDGVALKTLLEKAGVEFGHSLRGKRMASCLLVEAADGYRVVIALPEIDPDFNDKQVVLAFSQNGKPLDAKEGPFRIVIPEEKRMARWVKQVTTLKIVDVQ
jgi:hypothetical protein